MELKNRYDIKAFILVENANPNGDPDCDNNPRQNYDGFGLISDVSIKRTFRECARKMGKKIHLVKGTILTKEFEELGKKKKNGEDPRTLCCETYYDDRTFGGIITSKKEKLSEAIHGAVQVAFAQSVFPINPIDLTITSCVSREEDKDRTMGSKKIVPFAIYEVNLTVSAKDAQANGFTEEDFKDFLRIFVNMYAENNSSSKMGLSLLDPIFVFKHPTELGKMNSNILFNSVYAESVMENPTSLKDCKFTVDTTKLRNGVELFTMCMGDDEMTPITQFDTGYSIANITVR